MTDQIPLLVTDVDPPRYAERLRRCEGAEDFDFIVPEAEGDEALCACVPKAEAILCYKAPLSGAAIRSAVRLKLIQKHGRNCRNIDVEAATDRGIPVATCSLLRNASVAEHAMALLLACARQVIQGHRAVSEAVYLEMGIQPIMTTQWDTAGNWAKIEGLNELYGKTAGIVGMGDIGIEIARRCRAFEMEVIYHQRTPHSIEIERRMEVHFCSLNELVAKSDYIVLVLPHTPQTEGIIGHEELGRMKSTATIVNVGRGALIDEEAMVQALQNGGISKAGLDVYRQEPLPETSPLRGLSNVVLLPHTGGGSDYWSVDPQATLGHIRRFFREGIAHGVINMGLSF